MAAQEAQVNVKAERCCAACRDVVKAREREEKGEEKRERREEKKCTDWNTMGSSY